MVQGEGLGVEQSKPRQEPLLIWRNPQSQVEHAGSPGTGRSREERRWESAQVGDHTWRVPLKTLASLTTWGLLSLWGQMNVVIVLRRCRLQQHLPSPNYWKPSTLASVSGSWLALLKQ